jgi:heme exporter protein B
MSIITLLQRSFAVLYKETASEIRTKHTLMAMLLFVLITICAIAFTTAGQEINNDMAAALLWIILFFSAMTGLSRSFVAEEERGTALLLHLAAPPMAVYLGKLAYNILSGLLLNCLSAALFLLFINSVPIKNHGIFWCMLLLGSIGIAAATTLISAIIARAGSRGALFPVLSFPLVLPLLLLGGETFSMAFYGAPFGAAGSNLLVLFSYSGALITVSALLFEMVWCE